MKIPMIGRDNRKIPDLATAKRIIAEHARPTAAEIVALHDGLLRVPVGSLKAKKPQPGYDQASRDGFVLSGEGGLSFGDTHTFRIKGEIPAGTTGQHRLGKAEACRIMTGGLIPAGGERVVPQEDGIEQDGILTVPDTILHRKDTYIRRRGGEIGRGRVVVPAGTRMLPDHLVLLAATGHSHVSVHRRPRVTYLCTGSELVASPAEEREGLKVSGNRYLINGLIWLYGAIPEDLGTVADASADLSAAFSRIDRETTDLVISTGGMGPGRYDLLEQAFGAAGGRIVYRSLHVRPGKATLFGIFGNALFFGLPGPPPAVRVLFNELVGPALLLLQGVKKSGPATIRLPLQEAVVLKEHDMPSLKGALLTLRQGIPCARLAEKTEVPACYIFFPGNRRRFKQGEMVEAHLAGPPWSCI